jgi:proteasome lid subunit RPN8/RPN11
VTYEALIFTPAQLEAMLAHLLADPSHERCGLLAGQGNRVEQVLPVPNVLNSPVVYRMDGPEFAQAMVACDFEPLGIFHSHPAGPPVPSPTDIAQAMYPESVYVIIALNQSPPSVRAFRIVEGQVSEVDVTTEDG